MPRAAVSGAGHPAFDFIAEPLNVGPRLALGTFRVAPRYGVENTFVVFDAGRHSRRKVLGPRMGTHGLDLRIHRTEEPRQGLVGGGVDDVLVERQSRCRVPVLVTCVQAGALLLQRRLQRAELSIAASFRIPMTES